MQQKHIEDDEEQMVFDDVQWVTQEILRVIHDIQWSLYEIQMVIRVVQWSAHEIRRVIQRKTDLCEKLKNS